MKYEYYIDIEISDILKANNIDFSQLKISEQEPSVDIRFFIKNFTKYKIVEEPMSKQSGEFNEDTNSIIINSLDSEKRQRFSLAHELGHALLGHGSAKRITENRSNNYDVDEIVNEILANSFAARFLMPKKLLYYVRDLVLKDTIQTGDSITPSVQRIAIRKMSELLNVSREALNYRLSNINFSWE